jgi:Fe-S cluster assembly iron-binding protein IscA
MVLDEPREGDETIHLKGIEFVYDRQDSGLLNQTVIDYEDSWIGERFVISSPISEPC